MATVFWIGNNQSIAQVNTITVTAVALNGTLTATINTKTITYTCTATDTTTTAASNWLALLNAANRPAEFSEITWTASGAVILATSRSPGTPFSVSVTFGGGATATNSTTTANSSPNDPGSANNWLRAGVNAIPVNGDDVVLQDSSVSILYNLTALAAVQFNTFTVWQSYTGNIGLPENNPAGYYEYRPTYFQFVGPPAGTLTMLLGEGTSGSGPQRQRYNVGAQRTALIVLTAGSAIDEYAIRFLGTNVNNTVTVFTTSVGIGMLPAEVSTVASATVEGGGTLGLGAGVTFSGALTLDQGNAVVDCAPATITAQSSSNLIVQSTGLTYASLTVRSNSRCTWVSNSNITTLVLGTGSTFDKGQDTRAITITNSTQDGDTTQILDPWSAITWTNATNVNNAVASGPFTFGPGRTVKIT